MRGGPRAARAARHRAGPAARATGPAAPPPAPALAGGRRPVRAPGRGLGAGRRRMSRFFCQSAGARPNRRGAALSRRPLSAQCGGDNSKAAGPRRAPGRARAPLRNRSCGDMAAARRRGRGAARPGAARRGPPLLKERGPRRAARAPGRAGVAAAASRARVLAARPIGAVSGFQAGPPGPHTGREVKGVKGGARGGRAPGRFEQRCGRGAPGSRRPPGALRRAGAAPGRLPVVTSRESRRGERRPPAPFAAARGERAAARGGRAGGPPQ